MDVSQTGQRLVRAFRNIPGPICLPVVGNLYLYKLGILSVTKYQNVLQHLYDTYGPIVKEKIGPSTLIHVFDPDDAKSIYQNEGKMPYVVPLQETAQLYRHKANMSPGLGNINGEEWYRLRAAVRHLMLKPKDVQQFLPAVHEVTLDFVRRLHQRRRNNDIVPDIVTEFGKWVQECAGAVCFDKRLGYMSGGPQETMAEQVIQANKLVFHLSGLLKFSLPIYKYMPTPKWKRLVEAEDIVVRSSTSYIEEALKSIECLVSKNQLTNNRYGFLLSLLAKQELSKKDIVTLTLSLFTDGLSTTVPTVLFNLYALATNPLVQERAFEEISTIVGSSDSITPAHLSQLNYIKAVVKETFRMYPNGTEISRIIPEELVLSGYHVPAQTSISINMGVHFRSEKYFSEPNKYRPERWLRGEVTDNVHPYVLTPFGFGTRTCAGRRFAEQDMYICLAEIIRNFQLSYGGSEAMQQEYHTLLMPAEPLLIRFVPRH